MGTQCGGRGLLFGDMGFPSPNIGSVRVPRRPREGWEGEPWASTHSQSQGRQPLPSLTEPHAPGSDLPQAPPGIPPQDAEAQLEPRAAGRDTKSLDAERHRDSEGRREKQLATETKQR